MSHIGVNCVVLVEPLKNLLKSQVLINSERLNNKRTNSKNLATCNRHSQNLWELVWPFHASWPRLARIFRVPSRVRSAGTQLIVLRVCNWLWKAGVPESAIKNDSPVCYSGARQNLVPNNNGRPARTFPAPSGQHFRKIFGRQYSRVLLVTMNNIDDKNGNVCQAHWNQTTREIWE